MPSNNKISVVTLLQAYRLLTNVITYQWSLKKGVAAMGTESARQVTRKAMAFDLINILDEDPKKAIYTAEEIKTLINTYIETSTKNEHGDM